MLLLCKDDAQQMAGLIGIVICLSCNQVYHANAISDQTQKIVVWQLNGLRIKTLLEDWVDLTSPVRMHELYREFAELEASTGDMKRWCIFQEAAMRVPVNLQKNQEYDLLRVNLPLGTFGSIPRGLLKEWFNLGVLELPYCYQLTQLDLRGMRNLHTVGLRDCNKLVEIHCSNSIGKFDRLLLKLKCTNLEILSEKFGYLAALQILDIKDCASLTKAPDLGLCINLQELNMSNCYRLTTPPDLSRCVNLVKLNMSKCHRLKHPPKLDRCIKLQELNMYGNSDLTQLPRFHKLSALEKLEFSNCENVTKVVGLRSLSNLQDLRLACTEVGKLQGLGCLTALRRLNLIGCTRMKHIEDMSALTNLQEIWLQGSGLCKLPGLGKLNTLEMLDLRCDVLNNFPDLSPFASLQQLWIGSSQVTAVLGIDKLLQLEEIEFTNCKLLTQIPDLQQLPNLSFVWLINCSCVGNLLRLPESCILRECLPEEGNLRTSKTYNGRVEPISDILVC
jgi:Leucine-rich repeat (LRR) protein